MAISTRQKNQHLLWRAAFGPMAENTADLDNISTDKLWRLLQKTSAKKPKKIMVAANLVDGLVNGVQNIGAMQTAEMKAAAGKKKRAQYRDELKSLNLLWLSEMINGEAQLREKMSLFWHGHFAARVINSFFQQELLHSIRENALGNFGNLLIAVSKSPTMLQFLNNQQNRKAKPNENFAREVMELFTMGRGNYTEQDIKEGARAFTGWGYNGQGEFIFRERQHDDGVKTFLGQTGKFNGDDILRILLEQPKTAEFITRKIYKYFVNENINEEKVKWLSNRFYKGGYKINALLEDIFTSDWFYAEENRAVRIKSPVELIAGIRRFLPLELDNEDSQLVYQKILGQILFYPPNVAGWPGGTSWIDSSTLMVRMQIPQVLGRNEIMMVQPKTDDDLAMGQMQPKDVLLKQNKNQAQPKGAAQIEWTHLLRSFEQVPRENLFSAIANSLLQTNQIPDKSSFLKYLDADSRERYIKSAIIYLMSTPEYQMS